MIKTKTAFKYPPSPFTRGEKVIFVGGYPNDPEDGQIYEIEKSDHCYAALIGRRWAVPNWQLRKVTETEEEYLQRNFS